MGRGEVSIFFQAAMVMIGLLVGPWRHSAAASTAPAEPALCPGTSDYVLPRSGSAGVAIEIFDCEALQAVTATKQALASRSDQSIRQPPSPGQLDRDGEWGLHKQTCSLRGRGRFQIALLMFN
jgi:hypothetical protein